MLNKIRLMPILKCGHEESIVETAKKLKESMQRHIFVVNENDYPIGIISTTDMNNRVVAEGKDPNKLKARDIMTKNIEVYDIKEDVIKVFKEMKQNRRMVVAVVKNKKFEGILSFNALLNYITSTAR